VATFLRDHPEDRLPGDEVKAGDRLIEQEEVCLLHQALRDEDPLGLAAGELAEMAGRQRVHVESGHHPVAHPTVPVPEPPVGAQPRVPAHRDDLPDGHGHRGIDRGRLRDEGEPAVPGLGEVDVERSAHRLDQPGDRAEQGGLARPVRPDDGGDQARRDLEVGGAQGDVSLVAEDEVPCPHHAPALSPAIHGGSLWERFSFRTREQDDT
jgi:hypothetical protein